MYAEKDANFRSGSLFYRRKSAIKTANIREKPNLSYTLLDARKSIVGFLTVFLSLLAGAELLSFRAVYRQNTAIRQCVQQTYGTDTLFMGASHIAFGIGAPGEIIPNVAARSEPFLFTFKKLQLLRPRVAIIGLNVQGIQYGGNQAFEAGLLNVPQYRWLMDALTADERRDAYAQMPFETKAFYWTKRWIPFLGARLKTEPTDNALGGWENWRAVSELSEYQIRQRYRDAFVQYEGQLSDFQTTYLRRMLDYAKAHRIRIIFLSTPLHPAFAQRIPSRAHRDFARVLDTLRQTYDFAHYDYTSYELPETHFYDSDHLNGLGAAQFTPVVMRQLRGGVER